MKRPKLYRNIFYWPSFTEALEYAEHHCLPTNRIISYKRGWAIQLCISGPYVGPGCSRRLLTGVLE